jgi:subfamily B ATP-binding cassette protein MsbA
MRRASRKAMQESSTMLGQVEGTLTGIRVVKASRTERFERRRYRGIMNGLLAHQVRMSRIDAMSSPILETLTLLVVGAVVMYAAYLVKVTHALKTPQFFLVMGCLMMIAESLRKVSKVNNQLQKANSAAGRIFEILDIPAEGEEVLSDERRAMSGNSDDSSLIAHRSSLSHSPRRRLPTIQREIAFENITFTYPHSTNPALVDVSLTVPKGRSIAVVGRNGSGKTTLLALLPRFYDPQQGRVMIDGMDIRDASLGSLRDQITIVTQDPIIFPGTIASNIAYGNPRAKRDKIIEAAKRAFAHDFILEKPNGYDTVLGELGGQLSGGQKQRLCIARAILRSSPILILDEATSQVDAESEHLIQQAIESLMHERTTFVIAHRFSTITSADEIVVMDRGQIVGRGKHDQLVRTCETYQQLYERQLFTPAAV